MGLAGASHSRRVMDTHPSHVQTLCIRARCPDQWTRLKYMRYGTRLPVAQPTLTVRSNVLSLQYLSMASRT